MTKSTKSTKSVKTIEITKPVKAESRSVLALRAAVDIVVEFGNRANLHEITIDIKELNMRMTRAGFCAGSGATCASKFFANKYAREIVASRTGGRNLRFTSIKNEFGMTRQQYRDLVITPRRAEVKKVLEWEASGMLKTSVVTAVSRQWHETGFAAVVGTMNNDIAEVKAEMLAE